MTSEERAKRRAELERQIGRHACLAEAADSSHPTMAGAVHHVGATLALVGLILLELVPRPKLDLSSEPDPPGTPEPFI